MDTDEIMRNMVLNNQLVLGSVNAPPQAFQSAIQHLGVFAQRWPDALRSVITARFPLEHALDALQDPDRRREERGRDRVMSSGDWIDISVPLRNGMVAWPGDAPFERSSTLEIANGDPCNLSQISSSAHIGTHMDAPRHYLRGAAGMETMPIAASIGRVSCH